MLTEKSPTHIQISPPDTRAHITLERAVYTLRRALFTLPLLLCVHTNCTWSTVPIQKEVAQTLRDNTIVQKNSSCHARTSECLRARGEVFKVYGPFTEKGRGHSERSAKISRMIEPVLYSAI